MSANDSTMNNFIISSPAFCLPEATVVQMNCVYQTHVSLISLNSESVNEPIMSGHWHSVHPPCPKTNCKKTKCRVVFAVTSNQLLLEKTQSLAFFKRLYFAGTRFNEWRILKRFILIKTGQKMSRKSNESIFKKSHSNPGYIINRTVHLSHCEEEIKSHRDVKPSVTGRRWVTAHLSPI